MTERLFTWDELAMVRFEGDDYGCVTAFCRHCEVPSSKTYNGRTPMEIGYTEDGNPLELLRPVLEHIHAAHPASGPRPTT